MQTAKRDFGSCNNPTPQTQVVVIGAAGGVGSLAVQIAKRHFGAHVVGVCGPKHRNLVLSLGADEVQFCPEDVNVVKQVVLLYS